MRVYIAGPCRGIPQYNMPAFDAAEAYFRAHGDEVVNPIRMDGIDYSAFPVDFDWYTIPDSMNMHEIALRDIKALSECDAIVMLNGWRDSRGARAERAFAEWIGLKVFENLDVYFTVGAA